MLRTTFKSLAAHKFRLFATGLAVMLGVAFMAGTLVLTDTIQKTFDDLFADVYDDTDAVVRAEGGVRLAGHRTARAGRRLAPRHRGGRRRGGRRRSATSVATRSSSTRTATPSATRRTGRRRSGGNWIDSDELNAFEIVGGQPRRVPTTRSSSTRRAPTTRATASATPHRCSCRAGRRTCTIAGIAKFGDADSPGGASFVLFTTGRRAAAVAEPGKFDSILVVADDGISQNELVDRIAPELPDGTEAVTGDGDHQGEPGRHRAGPQLLQHVHARVRRGRPARRRLHHLQHVLHHGRAAHPRERAAAGARRQEATGARRRCCVEALAVGLIASRGRDRCWASSWRRGSRRSSPRSASSSRPAASSSPPAP